MLVCILGRQPELSLAELESVFGKPQTYLVSPQVATVDTANFDLSILGGTVKYGQEVLSLPANGRDDKAKFIFASRQIIDYYLHKWHTNEHKITLGVSAYNFDLPSRDIQKTGLLLKNALKKANVSLRLLPNDQPALSTATSHNNKLGLSPNKVEIIIVKTHHGIIVVESRGSQNITAYAKRDQNRPKRDAFVGMLPPKLAQIMLNLALGQLPTHDEPARTVILDPFCGTGTVLQEALLRGFSVHGSDLNPKMIDYTLANLTWLQKTHKQTTGKVGDIFLGDAMTTKWKNAKEISAIVCETYLGQPFSAPPSPEKLKQVSQNCNHIISEFLKNIGSQIRLGTRLCIAVPAWRGSDGRLTYLPLIRKVDSFGYRLIRQPLIYSRPDQVVARQILVLEKVS